MLLINASEDANNALSKGIKEFKQDPDVAGKVYINYLKKHDGEHPDMPSWRSTYDQHSNAYKKSQLNLESLETA